MRVQHQFLIHGYFMTFVSVRSFLKGKEALKLFKMVFEDCVPPSLATSKLNQTKCVRELISLSRYFL